MYSSGVPPREFVRYRSLFDLVEAHPALSCNDPKLLNWYLSLAPEDKKLVKGVSPWMNAVRMYFIQETVEMNCAHLYPDRKTIIYTLIAD